MSKLIPISCLLIAFAFSISAANDGPLAQRISRQQLSNNIRVNVNMVLVPVSVMDSRGRSVSGLGPENFRVFDGSHQVPIVWFGTEDQPITVGLIFDCSRSMEEKFRIARTSSFEELETALFFTQPRGMTSLLDGIYMGLQQIRKARTPRKALVVVSDGGDNNSRYTLRDLEKLAVEADTQIFAAGLYDNPRTKEEADGPLLLNELCERTGGANFAIADLLKLRDVMGKIGVSLHNQYVLAYYPPDDGTAGKYRKIKVQLRVPVGVPRLQINARTSYYNPEQ
jgi:Ca-activated chloride channel family protein